MPSASLYVAVKRQLVSVLSARLPSVQVDYAWLRGRALDGGKTPGEHVWLENLPELAISATPASVGIAARHDRHETFTVGVNCQVADGGESDPDIVELRAFALLAEVDDYLACRSDEPNGPGKSLGGMEGILEARLTGWSPAEPEYAGKGWAFRLQAVVEVSTWLT